LATLERIGMDASIRRLHWMICGFEGAALTYGALGHNPKADQIATTWLDAMFRRFVNDGALSFDTPHNDAAGKLRDKWRAEYPRFTLEAMLPDICDFIERFAPKQARGYYDFWRAGK
jgi:hypothetical protein